MGSDGHALLADVDAWLEAARALAHTLDANITQVAQGRELLGEGARLAEVVATMSTTARFLAMNEALSQFDLARFTLRSSLINAALAEGLTHRQLVELLGVPPELTARVLAEIESDRNP